MTFFAITPFYANSQNFTKLLIEIHTKLLIVLYPKNLILSSISTALKFIMNALHENPISVFLSFETSSHLVSSVDVFDVTR